MSLDDEILAAMGRIPTGPTPAMTNYATTGTVRPLHTNAESMAAAIHKLLADVPPEPFGEWMREQGFPPEDCTLLLPVSMKGELPFWPAYVQFSPLVDAPTLMRAKIRPLEPIQLDDVLPAPIRLDGPWWLRGIW